MALARPQAAALHTLGCHSSHSVFSSARSTQTFDGLRPETKADPSPLTIGPIPVGNTLPQWCLFCFCAAK